MTPRDGPYPDSFLDVRNQRVITTTAGRYSSAAPEVVNRRCASPELDEEGHWRYRERRRSEDQGIRASIDSDKTVLYGVGQYGLMGTVGVPQYGGGERSTPLICTTVYSSSRVDTTHVVWSDGYRNATGSSLSVVVLVGWAEPVLLVQSVNYDIVLPTEKGTAHCWAGSVVLCCQSLRLNLE